MIEKKNSPLLSSPLLMVEREKLLVMEHSFQRRYEKWKLSNGISVRRNSPIEESNVASEFIFSSTEENAMCITVL